MNENLLTNTDIKINGCLPLQLINKHKCILNSMKQECAICLIDLFNARTETIVLKCGHAFHYKCINMCLLHKKNKCPLCRQDIEFN
jgi:RING finger/CHY zinc finger protein 1